ncbi:MAG: efflux RND transporter periplasmic adaptor subunit [Flavitalea sp.]
MFSRTTTWIGFSISIFAISCGDSKSAAPPPPVKVVLTSVKVAQASYNDEYPATVTALNQIDLRPQVSGYITGIHFNDGARVKKNQLLYSIDNQLFTANYQQAVAGLSIQQANVAKAQRDADRYHELDKKDAVAKQLVDNADAALEVARKQADAAKANISGVQTSVRYTKVFAPFDGVIGISMVKPGTSVTAGQTVLNTVSSDNELAVDFNISQREIFKLTSLLKAKPTKNDSTFTLAFGNQVYPYPGKLSFIDRAVDPQTGTIKVRLIFPNTDKLLRAGMNGTVRVENNSQTQALLIPYKAVTEQLGEYYVYIPGDSSKVSQRKVLLGNQIGTDIIVKDGIKEGDSVVVEGVQNLKEGMVVQSVAK